MDLIEFREYCLGLGGVEEKIPFGKFSRKFDSVLVFYVKGHMFCMTDIDDFSFVEVYCSPEREAELSEKYEAVRRPTNPALKFWVRLGLGCDIPESVIKDLVKEAYDRVKNKYTK